MRDDEKWTIQGWVKSLSHILCTMSSIQQSIFSPQKFAKIARTRFFIRGTIGDDFTKMRKIQKGNGKGRWNPLEMSNGFHRPSSHCGSGAFLQNHPRSSLDYKIGWFRKWIVLEGGVSGKESTTKGYHGVTLSSTVPLTWHIRVVCLKTLSVSHG